MNRCKWCLGDDLMIKYHDTEWGVPLHDDQKLFEFMVLDCFQAGISWRTVLHKRENFRKAFANFDPQKVSKFTQDKITKLLNDSVVIRNKLKINATIENAKQFLKIQKEYGSFDKYIWKFTSGKVINNKWKNDRDVPAKTALSDKISKDLIKHGFEFVGSTICYAFMQAAGIVNDHTIDCFRKSNNK